MKITCVHCGKEMNDAATKNTSTYVIGKVICPHCHKQNKRYISEMDLHIISMGNMAIYGIVLSIMCLMTMSFYGGTGKFLPMILATIVVLVIVVVGITQWSLYVYLHAPMKKDWMNFTMPEDAYEVTKAIKRVFQGFLVLVVALGVVAMYLSFWYYVAGVAVYLGLMFIKLKAIQKREKEYFEARNV